VTTELKIDKIAKIDKIDKIDKIAGIAEIAEIAELPELPELPDRQRTWVVTLSLGIFFLILDLVRRRKVKEDDSWIWLFVGVTTFVLGTNFRLLQRISHLFGILAPTSTIFFFGQIFLMLLALQSSIRNSSTSLQIKNLVQELALLRAEVGPSRN